MCSRRRIIGGEYATQDDIRDAARRMFIQALLEESPRVFDDLLQTVLPVWLAGEYDLDNGVEVCGLRLPPTRCIPSNAMAASLEGWASRHNVKLEWVIDGMGLVLSHLRTQTQSDKPATVTPALLRRCFSPACEGLPPMFGSSSPLFKAIWLPEWSAQGTPPAPEETGTIVVCGTRVEAQHQLEDCVNRYLDDVEAWASNREWLRLTRTPEIRSEKSASGDFLDHYRWLVRNHVNRQSINSISKELDRERKSVREGIRQAALRIGLDAP